MKRSSALAPLSRDHHQALAVAQRLRRGEDAGGDGFLRFWHEHARRHFQIEEEVLLPHWAAAADADPDVVARIAHDHLLVRSAVNRLEHGRLNAAELERVGELMHEHVRFEERELFPLIERSLDPGELAQLAAAVTAAETAAERG